MICLKCGKNMTNTTDTKVYCMKCDILIHTPSGVAFTGFPAEDKFIGSTALIVQGATDRPCEVTLGPDALILNWKKATGKDARIEKIPFSTVTGIDVLSRVRGEIFTQAEIDNALLGNLVMGGVLLGSLLQAQEIYFAHVKTLKIITPQKTYEIFLPDADDWADRLRQKSVS